MRKRVIAHFMHEGERNEAERILSRPVVTEGFVMGEADEGQIVELQGHGLIVQPIDAESRSQPETPGLGTRVQGRPRSTVFSDRTFAPSREIDLSRPNVFLIEIPGPFLEEYRQQLGGIDVELLEAQGQGFYTARLRPEQVRSVRALPFVAQAIVYDGMQTVPTADTQADMLAPPPPLMPSEVRMLTFDVLLHRTEDVPEVIDWLDEHKVPVAGSAERKIRFYALEDSPLLGEIAALVGVARLEEFHPPKLWNDHARRLIGLAGQGGAARMPYDGSGEIVGIADTGIDDAHPDFSGRLKHVIARGRATADDPNGHGTHVAGSCSGDGQASNGALCGTAPRAEIVFQSLLDSRGGLGGLPIHLADLFEEAYQLGARVHNNSWGASTASTYTISSSEVDEFAAKRPDMLVVFAAGNEGQAADRLNADVGFVDWLSIGAPGTAKNALTVGASRSDRTVGGYSAMTWGNVWGRDFPDPPIAQERISGNPECLAAFSSRGPSDDRRIKPDVVAPGTDILSCRSAKAPLNAFWGPYQANPRYAFMGGTSMAAPLVAGCAAATRQFYREAHEHGASAALVRATIVNGTRRLAGADANASNLPGVLHPANFDQGFGCVDMPSTIPHPTAPTFALSFVDTLGDGRGRFTRTGERRRYAIEVKSGQRQLRICLAYTDAPGRGLQNNLNLFVESPDRRKLVGNDRLRHSIGLPDVDNNVEVVRVDDPKPGTWLLQIVATNLLKQPQDFALVVTGDLDSELAPT